uniref:Uncharacterized protein n=1 Tax=Mustela putorius furo TaxID=9669 RepID=M3XTP0_MUSPF
LCGLLGGFSLKRIHTNLNHRRQVSKSLLEPLSTALQTTEHKHCFVSSFTPWCANVFFEKKEEGRMEGSNF